MTAQPILEALAKEFSTDVPSIQATFEMLDAGLTAPFIGRFRRARTGAMSEVHVRRLSRRREELTELDRRRGTILRGLERVDGISPKALDEVRDCMDRFELEDLYVPHRRPEPEVQLALDRGLGGLADVLVAAVPKSERPVKESAAKESAAKESAVKESTVKDDTEKDDTGKDNTGKKEQGAPTAKEGANGGALAEPDATPSAQAPGTEPQPVDVQSADAESAEAMPAEPAPDETASIEVRPDGDKPPTLGHDVTMGGSDKDESGAEASPAEAPAAPEGDAHTEPLAEAPAEPAVEQAPPSVGAPEPEAEAAPVVAEAPAAEAPAAEAPTAEAPAVDASAQPAPAGKRARPEPEQTPSPQPEALVLTAELAKLCQPFVDPDKGVHTESEALAGAVRILSDRLGRDARLRGYVRGMMRKKGVLKARAIVDEKKAGRHKNLLKTKSPLRQLQGHRLTAIRQAQAERVLNTVIELEPKEVIGRVRASLGKHTRPELEPLLDDIARRALQQRILPVIEADVRLEMKERSDAEALRFLGSHLRQILLTPFFGRVPVGGVDVSAKGDLALAFLDGHGVLLADTRIEVGEKEPAVLGAEIAALATQYGAEALAVGSGKSARAAGQRIREAVRAANAEVPVMVVNDAGASSYANGARAREELAEIAVPVRLAITIGRRLQDPMAEFLKIDPKQLSLGAEQRLVSKANLRRVLQEAIESAVAFVGCDFDTVPRSVIEHLPGLDEESAKRLADRRDAGDIESREAIRAEGILDEAQWASVAAFLRMRRSPEPLDRTSLHPEQYQLASQLLESAGGGVAETLGRPGATKGLRRQTFDVDEFTWRDLMRELSFPGRDPRGRNHVPKYISETTDPIRLQPGRVLEGVVTNVASFGAFVDVGRKHDAMIHISELASRYVRDARELLSIGATIRGRIVDGSSSRLALSLKNVPNEERPERGPRRGGGVRRRGARKPEQPAGPAGRIWRRDGAAGAATSSRRGTRRGGPRRGGRDDFGGRGERVDLKKINPAEEVTSNNPFAKFFHKDEPAPKQKAQQEKADKPKPPVPKDTASKDAQPKVGAPTTGAESPPHTDSQAVSAPKVESGPAPVSDTPSADESASS